MGEGGKPEQLTSNMCRLFPLPHMATYDSLKINKLSDEQL